VWAIPLQGKQCPEDKYKAPLEPGYKQLSGMGTIERKLRERAMMKKLILDAAQTL